MSKTLESLIHLSRFMKFLMAEVLPDEKVDCPSYALNSLNEILIVTHECIEQIKAKQINSFAGHAALEAESSEMYKEKNEENILIQNCVSNSSISVISTVIPDPLCNEELVKYDSNTKLQRISSAITEKFMVLSDEMHNGRHVGRYCRPCDLVVFSKELWEKHLSYRIHYETDEYYENKESPCGYCNFIIFASGHDSEILLNYHFEKHTVPENTGSSTICIAREDLRSNIDSSNHQKKDYDKSSEENRTFNNNTIEESCNNTDILEEDISLSPVFVELNYLIHFGSLKGFYCHPCDEAFDSISGWNMHFQEEQIHGNHFGMVESFEKCQCCGLVIFGTPSVLLSYNKYHKWGHKSKEQIIFRDQTPKKKLKNKEDNIGEVGNENKGKPMKVPGQAIAKMTSIKYGCPQTGFHEVITTAQSCRI